MDFVTVLLCFLLFFIIIMFVLGGMTYFIWKSSSQIIENNLQDPTSQSQTTNQRYNRNKQRSASKKKAVASTTTTAVAAKRKEKKKAMKKLQQQQAAIEEQTPTGSSNGSSSEQEEEEEEKPQQQSESIAAKTRQKTKSIEDKKDINMPPVQQTLPKKPQASVAPTKHVAAQAKPIQQSENRPVQQQVKQNDTKPQKNQFLPTSQQLLANKTQNNQGYVAPHILVPSNQPQIVPPSQSPTISKPNTVQQDQTHQRLPPRQQRSANIQSLPQQQQEQQRNFDQRLVIGSRVNGFAQSEQVARIQASSSPSPQQQQRSSINENQSQRQSAPVQQVSTARVQASSSPSPQQQQQQQQQQRSSINENQSQRQSAPVQQVPTDRVQSPPQQDKSQINGFVQQHQTQEPQNADTTQKVQSLPPPQPVPPHVPALKVEIPSSSPSVVATLQPKIIDLVKSLPSTQALITELMLIFDSASLSYDELELIMYKIANKQCLLKHDWNRLFEKGQKVDPREHINSIISDTLKNEMTLVTKELQQEKKKTQELSKQLQDKEQLLRRYSSQPPTDFVPPGQHQNQLIGLQLQIRHLQDENQQLHHQINQFLLHPPPQPHYEPQYSGQQPSNENLKQQITILTKQLQQLTIKNVTLEREFTNYDRSNKNMTESLKKADNLKQQRIDQLLNDLNKFKNSEQTISQLKQDYDQLQTKYNQLQDKQSPLDDEQTLSSSLLNESEQLKQKEQEYADLEAKYQALKQTLTDLEEKQKQQQPHVEIAQIQNQLRHEQELIEQLKLNHVELEKQYELLKQNAVVSDELRQKQETIEQLTQENKRLKHELDLCNEQEMNFQKLQEELEKQRELRKRSSSELETIHVQLKEKQEHIENLQSKFSELESENKQIKQQLDDQKQLSQQENGVNIVNNHQSNEENDNLLKQIQLLTLELDELKQKNDTLRKRNWKIMDELNSAEKLLAEQKTNE
ncbi:unnamed protein product [Didymodactylos carnosus]|uniref:Uncharacterized protein n=1 Tax=Didymodactylos carnosus TaxID=1234261 RepID=A0A814GJE5_9BILA|nr:unnamed protein product [Didymodactylos carnosus]CAF0997161.1 unnamed protein product [Didymodactylos carnosus]CAF3567450.1 unnamed protein product [Didymodactylos carnosus]CAF3768711.1 unnamed protein product [Didymodactylos carnosus]